MRTADVNRNTAETQIAVRLTLEGSGSCDVHTGVGFMDHMLDLWCRHAGFDLQLSCCGDTQVDDHHSVEDIGIALGSAFKKALGDKRGISRYGSMILPMDETLMLCAVDLSGRSCLRYQAEIHCAKVGTFDTELVEEFLLGFVRKAEITLHIRQLDGKNSHHIIEAMFKAFGRALAMAVKIDEARCDEIPSTKGVLE